MLLERPYRHAASHARQGIHFDFIQRSIPDWLSTTTLARARAVQAASPYVYARLTSVDTRADTVSKAAMADCWRSRNAVDETFRYVKDAASFAEPLLKKALRDYGDIDVRNTFIRLYAPAKNSWWVIGALKGVTSRTVSLLDAALHNFSASEQFADYAFLSGADARGQQNSLTLTSSISGQPLTASGFKKLCRSLDIGRQYQTRLLSVLGFNNQVQADRVRLKVMACDKASLKNAACIAFSQQHITADAQRLLFDIVEGKPVPALDGTPVAYYNLSLLDARLNGVLLIAAPQGRDKHIERLIAYIPEDPEHPLKEYASPLAFMNELTRQLRDSPSPPDATGQPQTQATYRQFFSQFIDHKQRGHFFAELQNRLYTVRWHQKARTDSGPSWQTLAVDTPQLHFSVQNIFEDYQNRPPSGHSGPDTLWHYLYRVKLNKIVNDSREIAITTAYADLMARWAWWDNLSKILSDILNAALLVVTPFVPFLGELMLAYTACQVANDVFEGILDWAQGKGLEAIGHVMDVVEAVVQLGVWAGAGTIGQAITLKLSPFVESLHPVELASGEKRLWNPDLSPYQQDISLPKGIESDAQGVYQHAQKHWLAQAGKHYQVKPDPQLPHHRVVHPARPHAYQPTVRLNGSGAWVHEGEQPRSWDDHALMRRISPTTQALATEQLEQLRIISGSEPDHLRHMYVHNQPSPPLLADTLERFRAGQFAQESTRKMRTGQALEPYSYWFEQAVTELPGWPPNKALEVFHNSDLSGESRKYGNADAGPADTLTISLADVMAARLPERVLGFLDEQQGNALLGDTLPQAEQVQALRNKLADYVDGFGGHIAKSHYQLGQVSSDPHVALLRQSVPELPLSSAEALLKQAWPAESAMMTDEQRLPLRLKNLARELDFDNQASRAVEGLYPHQHPSVQSERLVLNTLRLHSDTFNNLKIDLRDNSPSGPLRCSVGDADAPQTRTLVRSADGNYAVFDADAKPLNAAATLYESLLWTLAQDPQRTPPYAVGEGEQLRQWVIEHNQTPAERRLALAEPPVRMQPETETEVLLGGGASCKMSRVDSYDMQPKTIEERIKQLLPAMSKDGVRRLSITLGTAEGEQTLTQMETQKQQLFHQLDAYIKSPTRWETTLLEPQVRKRRVEVATRLYDGWSNGLTIHLDESFEHRGGIALDLFNTPLPDELPTLNVPLNHISDVDLRGCEFSDRHAAFLDNFPHLRDLDLSHNQLTRLPETLGKLKRLRRLHLERNAIVLDEAAMATLARLKRLKQLELAGNPLGQAPDISQMPALSLLNLRDTHIKDWPAGLVGRSRARGFQLDLSENPITQLPHVVPGSDDADIIARTRLDQSRLTSDFQDLLAEYRESVGLDPLRSYAPKGESEPWLTYIKPAERERHRQLWDEIEKEPGSQGLFEVIRSLEEPDEFQTEQDRLAYQHNRPELSQRVWRLLRAVEADSDLRERVFKDTRYPGLCPDAGALIFQKLGVEVLASEAYRTSTSPQELEARLAVLTRGAARDAYMGKAIGEDIARRLRPKDQGGLGQRLWSQVIDGEHGEVDEAGIHLAYRSTLAERLDLPWLSPHMTYRTLADVTTDQVEKVAAAVARLEEGDGLVNQMLLDKGWERYLEQQHPTAKWNNDTTFDLKYSQLDELQALQAQYAESQDLPETDRQALQIKLRDLAQALEVDEASVLSGNPMTAEQYDATLNELGYRHNQWLRDLTRAALNRAGKRKNRA
ncbi:hypothetical protein IFT37_02535 [Pseudomonas fluorescens]|uniref:NEL-type E3 ubiquitin ligase domain-containing protein n=1 Tax=Pseudomonas fluorescens TaxID=294 RepID=UPI00177B7AC8|nr:NEL-type E3 ubiquitin ligase domain-containing protein [Pseudomonas fluorescens]MBD8151213.1 hypothetical protein [Pseudomonas fluorescens]MBD8175520.1 hypothetical protein [Pseudomonas fluorescens]MBD8743975.1 hypothetical protein [Pseudomonas fluorescens]MBD8750251.1 hypothetical protein [Pseudomonas fluorescens]MBD8759224.1 hypothetical protein [Pseudomonas fluorescens]